MALGGVIGGVLATIVAPLVLNEQLEYPILIAAVLFILPPIIRVPGRDWLAFAAVALTFLFVWPAVTAVGSITVATAVLIVYVATLIIGVMNKNHPARLAGMVLGLFAGLHLFAGGSVLANERSVFGIYRVTEGEKASTRVRYLNHGTTLHGSQALNPNLVRQPQSYFSRQGPLGDVMAALRRKYDKKT